MYTLIVLVVGFVAGWLARKYKEKLAADAAAVEADLKDVASKVEDKLK